MSLLICPFSLNYLLLGPSRKEVIIFRSSLPFIRTRETAHLQCEFFERVTNFSTHLMAVFFLEITLVLLLSGLVRKHDALGESRSRVVSRRTAVVVAVERHQARRRTRRGQAFVDEAAHGVHVHVAVGRVVLDVRRIGEQDQLHSHAAFGTSTGELLHILERFPRQRCEFITFGIILRK